MKVVPERLYFFKGDTAFYELAKQSGHSLTIVNNEIRDVAISGRHVNALLKKAHELGLSPKLSYQLHRHIPIGYEKIFVAEAVAIDPHCHYCGIEVSVDLHGHHPRRATFDHKLAKINGGKANKDNGILSCSRCNRLKSSMSYEEFMELKPWLPESPYWNMIRKGRADRLKLKKDMNVLRIVEKHGNNDPNRVRVAIIGLLYFKPSKTMKVLQSYREVPISSV